MRGFILDGSHLVVQQYDPAPKTMPPTVKTPGADIGPLANDPTREAIDSMRGYSYQVLCSVLAWVDLSEGELLFLEGAEDFDHIAGDTATTTQVRDTQRSGNITLRSKDTLQALNDFWSHRQRNPGRRIRFRYLTTSQVGLERGDPLGRGVPGIDLWRRAKAAGNPECQAEDLSALHAFLRDQGVLSDDLRDFLGSCSPGDFLSEIVQPIDWDTAAGDAAWIRDALRRRLTEFGAGRHVPAPDAVSVMSALHQHVWMVAIQDGDRTLDRAGFIRTFDEYTRISVPKSVYNKLVARDLSIGDTKDRLSHGSRDAPPPPALTPSNIEAIDHAFGAVSEVLLGWPQDTGGQWIERPELERLHELAMRDQPAVTALLGEPGGGKSAIFARLGSQLSEDGTILLAIKADRVPRTVATLTELDAWIGCEIPVAEALRRLAATRRVVVLIDQLDALADLMDRHSQRLSALLRLVHAVRETPKLQVLVSCREFEFRNDVRLNTLKAEKVSLARPSWDRVLPLLTARRFDTGGWSEEVRNVLCTPQHLAMFIEHSAGGNDTPTFTTYQGLLDRVIERLRNAHGERVIRAAEHIAIQMAEEEELDLGRARFDSEFGDELQALEAEGVLNRSRNGLGVTFRHQTLFDHFRARAFLRNDRSLAEHVLEEKQESLFVRPVLWSALNYLRAGDKAVYRREFGALWTHDGLRPHLRYLLVAFLGQAASPDDQEALWLLPALERPELRVRALRAMAGNPGWFARMRGRLPSLMTAPPEEAWKAVPFLARAATFESGSVLDLVERHWAPHERYLPHGLAALRDLPAWDARSVDIACKLVDHAPADVFSIRQLASRISETNAVLAPKVIARYLYAKLDRVNAESASRPIEPMPDTSESELPGYFRDAFIDRYERLIDGNLDWYDVDQLALRAPEAFIKEIWPWLADLFGRLAHPPHRLLNEYRAHHGLAFATEAGERGPLQDAIEAAVRGFAETSTEAFLDFVETNKHSDLMALHHLLALGLERIAEEHPDAVLAYLLEDRRRLVLGDICDAHRDSKALISAVAPALRHDDARRLENAIIEWQRYRETPTDEDAESRFKRRKWTREHRLRLLRAFPVDRLSPEGQRHLDEEARALPDTRDHDVSFSGVQTVESPMSAEQMAKAADDHILALFEELTDDTEWDHPRRRWRAFEGGSIQASRAFAEFAGNAPERALGIIRRFEVGTMERPAGAALAALGDSAVPPSILIGSIRKLDARGFASQEFRSDAARCLQGIARRADGLDDATCELLEGWITDWRPDVGDEAVCAEFEAGWREGALNWRPDVGDEAVRAGNERAKISSEDGSTEARRESLLWGLGGFGILPGGNYPFLDALMTGYLLRKPEDANGWLAVLERHLGRDEDPEVWSALAVHLQHLARADRPHTIRFFGSLLDLQPEIFQAVSGARLVVAILHWIPDDLFGRITDHWIAGDWADGPQAAGEVSALKLCRRPDDPEARSRVEQFLMEGEYEPAIATGLRLGVVHTLVKAWCEPEVRTLATPLLVRLASAADGPVANALGSIFLKADPLPPDDHTRELLEALLNRPSIPSGGKEFLVRGLKGLLREGWNPLLVHAVADALARGGGSALRDIRTATPRIAGDLADIALTLHRIPETRTHGLDLFERLMGVEAYGLGERLETLDRPAFR